MIVLARKDPVEMTWGVVDQPFQKVLGWNVRRKRENVRRRMLPCETVWAGVEKYLKCGIKNELRIVNENA